MNRAQFLREIERIFKVVFTQKIIQMVLRAAWVGGAVYLLCWGLNRMWGWLPDQSAWFWLAGITMVVILGSAFVVRFPSRAFVWRLDRGYHLQEQVYTTYEKLEEEIANNQPQPGVNELLDSDQLARLPFIRRELTEKGWRVRGEMQSTVIVLILLLIVYLLSVEDIGRLPQEQNFGLLPSLGKDPSAAEVLSDSSIPGDLGGSDGTQVTTEEIDASASAICEGNWDEVADTFVGLGVTLSQQSTTYDLGQSLQQQDFAQAADEFSNLAEQAGDLSDETKESLAQTFLDTAVAFQGINRADLSAYFQDASAALLDGSQLVMSDGLDELAALMDQCRYCPRPSTQQVSNSSQQSLEIEVIGGDVPSPANFLSNPILVEGGSIGVVENLSVSPGVEVPGYIQSLPYNLNLEDSDVVSSYFSPR